MIANIVAPFAQSLHTKAAKTEVSWNYEGGDQIEAARANVVKQTKG